MRARDGRCCRGVHGVCGESCLVSRVWKLVRAAGVNSERAPFAAKVGVGETWQPVCLCRQTAARDDRGGVATVNS